MLNNNILDEFDELFGGEGEKTAAVNLESNSDSEITEMLETAGKEVVQLGGAAEEQKTPEVQKEPVKEPVETKEDTSKTEDASKTEDTSKDEGSSNGQLGLFPQENTGKASNQNACSTSTKDNKKGKKGASCSSASSTPPKPKEPEKDLERFIILTNYNEQRTFDKEMTLEEIRAELEKEYPAYSKENTSWYFEKQEGKNRYMCIPNYKSNKAG